LSSIELEGLVIEEDEEMVEGSELRRFGLLESELRWVVVLEGRLDGWEEGWVEGRQKRWGDEDWRGFREEEIERGSSGREGLEEQG